jgi:hypothetical protein
VKRQSGVVCVAPVQPSFHFLLQSLPVGDAPVEALGDEDSQLGFGHVQPAAVLGRVMPFETLDQAARLGGWECFVW